MTLRPATAIDLPELVEMGLRFLAEEYDGSIVGNAEKVRATAQQLVDAGAMFVLEDRGGSLQGMTGWLVYDHFLSGERVASPVCWWVNPPARQGRNGLRLWTAGIDWARSQGATRLQASAPNPTTERIYQVLQLEKFETHYQRSLA
jgi:hypothetical protein